MYCKFFQSFASDAMSGKVGAKISPREHQRPIVVASLVVAGTCVLTRLLDQLVFGVEDGITTEMVAASAFVIGTMTCMQHRRRQTPSSKKAVPSKDTAPARRISDPEAPARRPPGRRPLPRAPQASALPRRSQTEACPQADEQPFVEVGPGLIEVVVKACAAGNLPLAEERFASVLEKAAALGAEGAAAEAPKSRSCASPANFQAQALVDAILEAGEHKLASKWFTSLHSVNMWPGVKVLYTVVSTMANKDLKKEAIEFYWNILESGVQADTGCLLLIFDRCTPAGDSRAVESWLEMLRGRNPFEFSQGIIALLRSKAQTKDARQAEAWMARAVEAGVAPSVQLYNGVIHAIARNGETDRAEAWLRRMEEASKEGVLEGPARTGEAPQRVDPDVISYSAIMDSCAQHGETQRAEAWFEKMVAAGITPDNVSFNTMIKAHARGGDLAGAERWLQAAREVGIRLDAFGYNAVIAAAARAMDPHKAESWLRQMIEDDSEPDVVSYNSVINAWAKKGDAAGAKRLVGLMCEKDVEPDVVTLGVAVHACAKAGDLARAEAIFEQIVSRGKTQPDAIGYNALINAAVKAGETARAEHWLKTMLDSGVAPSVVSYTTVLHAHARAGNIEKAEEGLERMIKDGIDANVVSYSALIHACVKAGDVDRAEKWFNFMRKAGIQANTVSYSVLLNVCAKAGDFQRAEKWLQTMYDDQLPPNVVCYNNIIDACAKAGHPDRAEHWLRHLTGEKCGDWEQAPGLAPTRQSYTTAAQAYASQGLCADVERLLKEMEDRDIVMDEFSLTVLLSAYSRARPRKRERAEKAFRDYTSRGLPVTKPPLRVLRSIVGGQRFERLVAECGVSS